ncbi:hypothetical protein FIBSPDRAFT_869329, partial [Athelia psychrophila]
MSMSMSGVTDAGACMQHRQRNERISDIARMKARAIPEWGAEHRSSCTAAPSDLRCSQTLIGGDHRSPVTPLRRLLVT